jgi:hypothetical protein
MSAIKPRRILTEDDLAQIKTTVAEAITTEAAAVIEEAIDNAVKDLDVEQIVEDAAKMKWEVW